MASSVTELIRKSRITPVLAVLIGFIFIDLGVAIPSHLEKMQAKAKATGLDVFDWTILVILVGACIGKTIASFMNKGWTRYADERDAEHKEERRKENGTQAHDPTTANEGHLR